MREPSSSARDDLAPITWQGVAQMECATLRELQLREGDDRPAMLFCYRCGHLEPVARLAAWEAVDAVP